VLIKIKTFRTLQKLYMPGAAAAMAEAEGLRDADAAPPKAEKIKLWMPSEMARGHAQDTLRGCVRGLLDMEIKMRVSQCENSLVALRSRLHAKRFLIGFRNGQVTGQVGGSRASTLIGQVGERVEAHKKRYRRGREALEALSVVEEYPHLRSLEDADVALDGDWGESDAASRKKLAMLGSGRGARTPRNAPGTSKRVMSWIWTAPGALADEEARLHDCECTCRFLGCQLTRMDSYPGGMGSGACTKAEMDRGGDAPPRRNAPRSTLPCLANGVVAGKGGVEDGGVGRSGRRHERVRLEAGSLARAPGCLLPEKVERACPDGYAAICC
jgi:hypothetical protein